MYVDIRSVLRKHEEELRRFRQNLFSADPPSELPAAMSRHIRTTGLTAPTGFGPVRSVTDRHAVLTVLGDISDQAVLLERPDREGSVLTLSVAARHKQLGTRQAVDSAEAGAWVKAIVGSSWAPHVYTAGALSGFASAGVRTSHPLTTRYFYLFLSRDGVPHAEPEHQLGVELSLLDEADAA
ncbi:hypothetical protein [Streptomyces sp. NPDC006012]|uniref:hypothetical protein n=1 Tax=Streptomyces sp. NPDC006012 TaxID=3364739 RepID=UPI0036BE0306